MGRIIAIDYGLKRTGIAVSDPLRIIASPLDTIATANAIKFLVDYSRKETVDELVIGMPKKLNNEDSEIAPAVRQFIVEVKKAIPHLIIHEVDERFTSRLAQRALIEGGMKKKDRRDKGNVDKVSAAIILQDFMNAKSR